MPKPKATSRVEPGPKAQSTRLRQRSKRQAPAIAAREEQRRERRTADETREHVLAVAQHLFYWHGIRATGIDKVAADAAVAPTALYRLFPSKDALIAAYVARLEVRYREWFETATRADGRSAGLRLLALFDALIEQVQPERCRGCPFVMAVTELPDTEHEANQFAVRLKKWVRARFRRLAGELASERPAAAVDAVILADHLMLLFEGVYATAQTLGADGPARRARQLVATLVGG